MSITRRRFTQAGLAAGATLVLGNGRLLAAASDDPIARAIPSSGEKIPVVGLGTNRYGVGDDAAARVPLKASLAEFHKLGGTVVDTAPGYRSSEVVLGELIAELGIGDDLFMATKVDTDGRTAQAKRMEQSFDRLRFSHIDLMQCHNLIDWENAIPVMREWQQDGRIGYVGITSSRNRQYDEMERIMKKHDLDFIQINYSLADQRESAERLIPLAADRGMAVLVNRPFGGGGVFGKVGAADFPAWATDFDCDSWAQFLLKYVISHPAVTAAIPGMTDVRHVQDNMQGARGRLPDAATRKRMESFFDAL